MTEVPTFPFVVGGLDVATDRVEGPLIDLVTRHDDEEKAKTPAERKRDQRERDAAAGVVELKVRVGPAEAAQLAEGLEFRAFGGEPYTATEYLLTLIRRDNELLRQQRGIVENKICSACQKPLPRGCGGVWAGELSCALPQLKWALAL
jgi:hypothetical protein